VHCSSNLFSWHLYVYSSPLSCNNELHPESFLSVHIHMTCDGLINRNRCIFLLFEGLWFSVLSFTCIYKHNFLHWVPPNPSIKWCLCRCSISYSNDHVVAYNYRKCVASGQLPVLPYCIWENMNHLPVKKCTGVIYICTNFFLYNKNNMVMTVVN